MADAQSRQPATPKPKRLTVAETYARLDDLTGRIENIRKLLNSRLNDVATKGQARKAIGMLADLQGSIDTLSKPDSEDPPDPLESAEPDHEASPLVVPPSSPSPPNVSDEPEREEQTLMDPKKQHAIVAVASFWALLVTIVSCLMMAGAPFFRPEFYYGTHPFVGGAATLTHTEIFAIDAAGVISVAKCVLIMLGLAITYRLSQFALTKCRPVGPAIHPGIARLDLLTSFLPVVANVIVFAVSRMSWKYDAWWLWLQAIYFVIIIVPCVEDAKVTITYWRANRAHV